MLNHHSRSAYTLIEILVATAVSMILMLAIMRMFGGIGESLNKSRADMNLALEMRRVESLLQNDLENSTLKKAGAVTTDQSVGVAERGYFTYQEGPMWAPSDNEPRLRPFAANPPRTADGPNGLAAKVADTSVADPVLDAVVNSTTVPPLTQRDFFSLNMAANDVGDPDSTVGDLDDQLAFTVQVAATNPVWYRGRGIDASSGLGIVESREAEVAWFVRGTTLYRRVLLIDDQAETTSKNVAAGGNLKDDRTGITLTPAIVNALWATGKWEPLGSTPLSFYDIFDASVRWDSGVLAANRISDLADRQNRFGCNRGNGVPGGMVQMPYPPSWERPSTLGDQCLPSDRITRPATIGSPPVSLLPIPDVTKMRGDFWEPDPDLQPFTVNQPSALTGPSNPPVPTDRTQPRRGEDAVLKNVLSFDVKAWIHNDPDPAMPPGYFADLGWRGVAAMAYSLTTADLTTASDPIYDINTGHYNDFSIAGRYGDPAGTNRPATTVQMSCLYDTWWSTSDEPPYGHKSGPPGPDTPAPLRAIQVTLRVFEPQHRTVQEVRLVKRLEP